MLLIFNEIRICFIVEFNVKLSNYNATSSSHSSKISTQSVNLIIDRLLSQSNRISTSKAYLNIWRQSNKFLIQLDSKPKTWEDRVTMFIAFKIDKGMQSSTVKSYISAIKKILIDDGYFWEDKKMILGSLTKACKIVNDSVRTRLPIQCSLLELILFKIERMFSRTNQCYLQALYQCLFAISYYGLMRVSEVMTSDHVIKAKNVHAAENKDKLLIILYSSKTHNCGMKPQHIKITSNLEEISKAEFYRNRNFCPFDLVNKYLNLRGRGYASDSEQFFIFRDRSPVHPDHAHAVLKNTY